MLSASIKPSSPIHSQILNQKQYLCIAPKMTTSSTSPSPNGLNILIIGAGCAGPALALLLQKSNPYHTISVIERLPSLRTGGQQLDLKAQGLTVARHLDLLPEFKEVCVKEAGLSMVNSKGQILMHQGVNDAKEDVGAGFNLTNEYEIMRGDIVKVLYNASLREASQLDEKAGAGREGSLTYHFDTTITALEQSGNGATVEFSNGQRKCYDLVVAADGQNSRTRRMAFDKGTNAECFNGFGVQAAYFNIPRLPSDNDDAHTFIAPGGRAVLTRTGNRPVTQVYFFTYKNTKRNEQINQSHKQSIEQQKELWTEIFKDAGYECERFVKAMQTTTDFYSHEIGQVRMQQHHAGRVVLLGDAGYCPSPFTGMGTTLSLIGSHVLAGELAKHGSDVDAALQSYDRLIRLALDEHQPKMSERDVYWYPSTAFTIGLVNTLLWTASFLRLDKLVLWASNFFPESKSRYELPLYPGLGLPA